MQVRCPACGKPGEWHAGNPFRPFCSERCRLVDLGDWFSGARAIPGEPEAETAVERPEDADKVH